MLSFNEASVAGSILPILFDAAAKGFVILALAGCTALALRRSSAAVRHLVWFLAVASMFALPVLSATLPAWRILPHWLTAQTDRIRVGDPQFTLHPPQSTESNTSKSTRSANTATSDTATATDDVTTSALPLAPPASARQIKQADPQSPFNPWNFLLWVWLTGMAVALLPLGVGWLSLGWLRRTSQPVRDPSWRSLLGQHCRDLGVNHPILLLRTARRTVPLTWGALAGVIPNLRSMMLIPEEASDWTINRRRAVLLHELAHIKRRDCLTQTITQLACAVYWFNPLIWFASKRMLTERERACDDLVLRAGMKSSDYAEDLLQIASGQRTHRFAAFAGIAMARRSNLEGRLLDVLDTERNRKMLTRPHFIALLLVFAAACAPLGMMRSSPWPIKVGVVVSYYTGRGPQRIGSYYGFGHAQVAKAFMSPEYEVFAVIEPGTQDLEPMAEVLEELGLARRLVDGTDEIALANLDVIVCDATPNVKDEMITALTKAVGQGVHFYNIGRFGSYNPGNTQQLTELLGIHDTGYLWYHHQGIRWKVVNEHPLVRELKLGTELTQMLFINGWAGKNEGIAILQAASDGGQPFRGFNHGRELEVADVNALYVHQLGKGTVVVLLFESIPSWSGEIAGENVPPTHSAFHRRAVNWLARGTREYFQRTERAGVLTNMLVHGQAININPIFHTDSPHFKGGQTMLWVRNNAHVPLKVKGKFADNEALKFRPARVKVTVAPHSQEQVKLTVKPVDSVRSTTDKKPLSALLQWVAEYDQDELHLPPVTGQSRLVIEQIQSLTRRVEPVVVDGKLDEWVNLPLVVTEPAAIEGKAESWTGADDCTFRFAVTHDEQYVYIALEVLDDIPVYRGTVPWFQDGIEVRIDGRPDPQRSLNRGQDDYGMANHLFIALSPHPDPKRMVFVERELAESFGVKATCVTNARGYTAEIAVPVSYFEQRQGKDWQRLRLNIAIDDYDDKGGLAQLWWRSDWRDEPVLPGSGTFAKE